jgi:P4 family phage/plasmid primase-like protien
MQLTTFITKATTIAKTLMVEEMARPEIEKIAKSDKYDYSTYVDSIISKNCSILTPFQLDENGDKNQQYQMFPEAFVEQRPTLKVLKRGDNRVMAEYVEDKKHYIEYSDNEAVTIIHNSFVKNRLHKFCTQKHLKDTLSNIKDTLHCNNREIDGTPNARYINFSNGLFDVETLSIIPHSHEYFTLAQSPYGIDLEQKDCPMWNDYLKKVTDNDKQLEALLQEAMGYCIFGQDIQGQKAFFLYSEASGTGKSTFLQVLRNLVGEKNTSSLSLEKLVSLSPMLKTLIGKRVNINDELGTKYLEASTISAILSGEDITFDVKYKDAISMNFNQTRFIFSTNQLPNFNQALGMDRRIAIIPFMYRFYGSTERVYDFYKIVLEKESGAILNWAIDGYLRIKQRAKDGEDLFTESKASLEAALDYKNTIDPVSAYLTDYELIASLQLTKENKNHLRVLAGNDDDEVYLLAKDMYGEPERFNRDKDKREAATGFFLFCQLQNYTQKINFLAFSRRVSAHCSQDNRYEVLSKREGKGYRLTDEFINSLDSYRKEKQDLEDWN